MNYLGMDAATGLRITDDAHLAQSIRTVLTTVIGTRQRRRPFGSLGPNLIDAPNNPATVLQLYAASAAALAAWEPRIVVRTLHAQLDTTRPSALVIDIDGEKISQAAGGVAVPFNLSVSLGA